MLNYEEWLETWVLAAGNCMDAQTRKEGRLLFPITQEHEVLACGSAPEKESCDGEHGEYDSPVMVETRHKAALLKQEGDYLLISSWREKVWARDPQVWVARLNGRSIVSSDLGRLVNMLTVGEVAALTPTRIVELLQRELPGVR